MPGDVFRSVVTNFPIASPQRLALAGVAAVLFIIWISFPSTHEAAAVAAVGAHYLHLLIPGITRPDTNLCKTLLTAQILHYPIPLIIPGDVTMDGLAVPEAERPHHQLKETFDWLNAQPINADENVVVLLDGPTTWFQLRPEVLLQRYHNIIRRANEKLGSKYQARILLPAQKECTLNGAKPELCEAVSHSPLVGSSTTPYLGWGAMVGPVKDLRALFQHALDLTKGDTPLSDTLPLFSEIYGEQELQRAAARQGNWLGRAVQEYAPKYSAESGNAALTLDFHIALDYDGELGFPTTSSDDGTHWAKPNPLPADVKDSMPPFWTVSDREATLPRGSGWANLELLTCPHTDVVPAMIHLPRPSSASTEKPITEELWTRHWAQAYGRDLYTAAQRLPPSVLAQVTDHFGQPRVYWNKILTTRNNDNAGAYFANKTWLFWENMCSSEPQWKEVFRDDLGPWHRTDR